MGKNTLTIKFLCKYPVQIPVYQITLTEHSQSQVRAQLLKSLDQSRQSFREYSWPVQEMPAIRGEVLPEDWPQSWGLHASTMEGKFQFRRGAWGCLLSHLRLWQLCVRMSEPICILEQDAQAQAPYSALRSPRSADMLKLWMTASHKQHPQHGQWSKGLWAYVITPVGALKLIDRVISAATVTAADKYTGDQVITVEHLSYDQFKLTTLVNSSTSRILSQDQASFLQWRRLRRSQSKNQR